MADETLEPAHPKPRPRRPPILAVFVAVGSVYLLWALREETAYFFQPSSPVDLGSSEAPAAMEHNRHVRVQGIPDRTRTVILDGRWGRHQAVFRLHGSRSRLFVSQPRKHRMPPDVYSDVFEGRLLRLADQPYFPQLYRYFVDHLSTPVDVPIAELVRAAGRSPAEVRDGDGAPFSLDAKDELFVSVLFPGEFRVQFDRARYPKVEESDTLLASFGLPWGPLEESRALRSYVVQGGQADADRLFERFRDPVEKVGVLPRAAAVRCRWGDVKRDGGNLVLSALGGPAPVRFLATTDGHLVAGPSSQTLSVAPERIRSVEAQTPFVIPPDAMILREKDHPRLYWYIAAADVALLALLAINGMVLLRRRGGDTP